MSARTERYPLPEIAGLPEDIRDKILAVQEKVAKRGKLGPVARLGPTTTARTLRKDREPFLLTDGPYAETKEQILGFYVVDFDSAEEAMAFTRELGVANPGGAFEVRPLIYFEANSSLPGAEVMPNVSA